MKPNVIVIIIVTLIAAAGIFWYFFTNSGNQSPLTITPQNTAAQAQFQTLVEQLQSITFDTAIFSNPKFTSLVDIHTPVSPEPTGRPDPFATVGG